MEGYVNNLKTVALLGFLSALVVLVAQAFGLSAWAGLGITASSTFPRTISSPTG